MLSWFSEPRTEAQAVQLIMEVVCTTCGLCAIFNAKMSEGSGNHIVMLNYIAPRSGPVSCVHSLVSSM